MKYRKKSVVVEAEQWLKDGDNESVQSYYGQVCTDRICRVCKRDIYEHGAIETLEGYHIVCPGDYIITGIKGEHYPCKPGIFAATYEPADAPADRDRLAGELAAARGENERFLKALIKSGCPCNLGFGIGLARKITDNKYSCKEVDRCAECWRQAIEGVRVNG